MNLNVAFCNCNWGGNGVNTPWPTFNPVLNPHWATYWGRFAVSDRKPWVITLPPISFPPTHPQLSHEDQGSDFSLLIWKTWWMDGFIWCLRPGVTLFRCRHPIYWVLLVWTLSLLWIALHTYTLSCCIDALTSQLPVMSTHWSLSPERVAHCWTTRSNRDTNHFVLLLGQTDNIWSNQRDA